MNEESPLKCGGAFSVSILKIARIDLTINTDHYITGTGQNLESKLFTQQVSKGYCCHKS